MYAFCTRPCNVINTGDIFFVPGPETNLLILSVLGVLIGRIRETGTVIGKTDAIEAIMMRKEGEVVAEMVKDLTVTDLVKGPAGTRIGTVIGIGIERGAATVMVIVEIECATEERVGMVIGTVTATSETGDESGVMI
jgi:hypothetical protein